MLNKPPIAFLQSVWNRPQCVQYLEQFESWQSEGPWALLAWVSNGPLALLEPEYIRTQPAWFVISDSTDNTQHTEYLAYETTCQFQIPLDRRWTSSSSSITRYHAILQDLPILLDLPALTSAYITATAPPTQLPPDPQKDAQVSEQLLKFISSSISTLLDPSNPEPSFMLEVPNLAICYFEHLKLLRIIILQDPILPF